ncbi:MAG: sterol desaturase family protein [Cytophagaceae bacterium]
MQLQFKSDPYSIAVYGLITMGIVFLRYLIIAGIFFFIFQSVFKKHHSTRSLNKYPVPSKQIISEIKNSLISSVIFGIVAAMWIAAWNKGWVKVYMAVSEYPIWVMPVTLPVYMFLHETYYYFIHRWMHTKTIYRLVHKEHHNSIHTTAFTSFSFHPIESLLQAVIIPFLTLIIPIHFSILLLYLTIMTVSAVINHLSVEIYPKNFQKNIAGKWLIGATHHSLHHGKFNCNFGLHFTFWDKILKTESPEFQKLFCHHTSEEKPLE